MAYSLSNVFTNESTFVSLVRVLHREVVEAQHLRVNFSVLIDDGVVEDPKPRERKVKNVDDRMFDYPTLMGMIHTEHPTPNYNCKEHLIEYVTKVLGWMIDTPQIMTNRVLVMLMFMYVSEKIRDVIRADTSSTVGRIYFDGSTKLPFKVPPFEERFETMIMGVMAPDNLSPLVVALVPPFCVFEELMLYEAIVDIVKTKQHEC